MADSRFELLSKKLIKPSSPTPPEHRDYKLSFMDQLMTSKYMSVALFYSNESHGDHPQDQTSLLLEKSLSEILTLYYPFAGKLSDNVSINCNDMGVTFLEARIKCPMSDVLEGSYATIQNTIFPSSLPWSDPGKEDSLLVVQLTHFDCGGKSLSLCMSHKFCDVYTLCKFLSDWAATVRQSSEKPSPQFVGTSIFPPPQEPISLPVYDVAKQQYIVKKLKFDASQLDHLKATVAAESGVENPTTVETVVALLYKSAMTALLKVKPQSFKPSVICLPLNLRPLTVPPLEANTVGNFVCILTVLVADEGDINLPKLVGKLRQAKLQIEEKYRGMKENELVSTAVEIKESFVPSDIYLYNYVSLCDVPFGNLDFGWGTPTVLTSSAIPSTSSFILMDDHTGNGVEVILALDEQVMPVFQNDKDILEFASLDPNF